MATSLNRKNRRRKKAAGLVAVGASATLLAGGLMPAQANAFRLGSLPGVASCAPGDSDSERILKVSADCRDAKPAVMATVGDALLGLVMPKSGLSLGTFNGALATSGLDLDITILGVFKDGLLIPGKASIAGTGYNTAIVIFGGEANASSDYYFAAAAALAAAGGVANAKSLFGISMATAVGRPAAKVGFGGPLSLGYDALENSATANALPFGMAIANSSNVLHDLLNPKSVLNGGKASERHVSATALGGTAAAFSAVDGSEGAVCTAIYGEASVKGADGKNIASCTSILYLFQQSQDGSAPVAYAIKNPFDVDLVSPFGDDFATLLSTVGRISGKALPVDIPAAVFDLMAGKFVPEYGSDIVRVSFVDGKPVFATDLPVFFQDIFAQGQASGALLGLNDLGLSKADVQSVSGYGIGGPALERKLATAVDDDFGPEVESAPLVPQGAVGQNSIGGVDLGGHAPAVDTPPVELEPAS